LGEVWGARRGALESSDPGSLLKKGVFLYVEKGVRE